jgi:uncharacterized protein (TIGR00369 family)
MTPSPRFRYATLSPEDIAGLTGKQVMQGIVEGRLPQPMICRTLSFWLAEVGDGFAMFEGETGEQLLNPAGTVHGGWALTLIDSATGCAAYTLLPADGRYTTIETKANFSRPIMQDTGRVRCEARVVSQGRQIISCESWIKAGDGRILAHGTSTLIVLGGGA